MKKGFIIEHQTSLLLLIFNKDYFYQNYV